MTATEPIVEMENISIEFPGVKALQNVNFRLFPGEVHTLMGENGAGKSTLIKALTGVYKIDSGTITVAGGPRRFTGTADAQSAGISTVYQEVNLCDNLTVGENVMLGHEVHGPFGINWRKTHEAAHDALTRLGLGALDSRQPLSSISLALQQLVAISRAMVTNSKVLILDEPTSSLDANEVEGLFTVIRRLRDEGVAILFVSHFLDQVYAISDRLTVLRNGRTRDSRPVPWPAHLRDDRQRRRVAQRPGLQPGPRRFRRRPAVLQCNRPRPEGIDRTGRHRRARR
jgi:monosaccharide-transporting ATPase